MMRVFCLVVGLCLFAIGCGERGTTTTTPPATTDTDTTETEGDIITP